MDRRIKKNQTAIMDALIQLMAEKDFEKITIHEIAECANVNRGTIYSHYLDKYDLLDKCIETQLKQLIESCLPVDDKGTYSSKASLLRTFELMEKNALFFRTLLTNKGVPSFRNHLQEMMKEGIREQIDENNLSLDDLRKEILVQFLSSATVGVIEWWFTHTMPCSAQEITEQLWALLQLNQVLPFIKQSDLVTQISD
ncbi:TetR/AcrR family transcriptional regulator [Paenibacillus monticola]|uniref:TetR family transcriptional regulator n=1 Tax=Paenibacillus monticola TaxID=2666075 RepID=A0A7X2L306_9BACL|nr:TetR/AcrR family transcriptional regulator [Paenibacillus monticola]MRN55432.1 TetR family transcriptional regulator [Paenibacillus monticola]